MKTSELKKKANPELQKLLKERRERLRVLRFDLSLGKLKNVRGVGKIKKEIARILTLLKQT